MKPVYMIVTSWCPHCKRARGILQDLLEENPAWKELSITIIDEENDKDQIKPFFNYYYVPTVYVGEDKSFEGVPSEDLLREALETAYNG
ncbi:MAG: glutaredoxin family protein [Fastidiosipilaceae bacterium]|nr:glutaredoxin [Clostridiaceae bacterium]